MGYERKRGKLGDLNAFLRGGPPDAFSRIVGDTGRLTNVKYVITLDTDTQLPRDAARQLVGAMAHPLNRADPAKRRSASVKGMAFCSPGSACVCLAPRNPVTSGCSAASPASTLTRGPYPTYTRTCSGEGSSSARASTMWMRSSGAPGPLPGKPHSQPRSGGRCYARSGLLTDIQVYEEYPRRYSADVSRRHRWIRGDWQLLRWLLPWVPGAAGRQGNPSARFPAGRSSTIFAAALYPWR